MTLVEYKVTTVTKTRLPPCTSAVPELIASRRYCDPETLCPTFERFVMSRVSTPLPDGRCHDLITMVEELYRSNELCPAGKPLPPVNSGDEWIKIATGPQEPMWLWQKNPAAKTSVTPPGPGGCRSFHKITYTSECPNNRLVVTRVIHHTISTPLPDGTCYTLEYQTRERFDTDTWCDPLDPCDPMLAERLWRERVVETPVTPPHAPGTLPLGNELDTPRAVRGAVRAIRQRELDAGVVIVSERPRDVVLRSVGGAPATHQALGALVAGAIVGFEIGIEGSDFTETLEYAMHKH